MRDTYQREINFAVSVTDRCNLRCVYCMPLAALSRLPRRGSETGRNQKPLSVPPPLSVLKNSPDRGSPSGAWGWKTWCSISEIPGIDDITLTTNALLLAPRAVA